MRWTSIILAVAGLISCAALSFGEETWLSYRVSTQIDRELGNVRSGSAQLSQEPTDLAQRPDLVAEKPWYGKVLGERFVILDESRADSGVWDVLWFDADANGKLEPDERFGLSVDQRGRQRNTVVAVAFPSEDGPVVQHFLLSAYARPERAYLQVRSAGYYIGQVRFGEKSHLVALVDNNANGTFNDPSTGERGGDRILIDCNDDGKFENYYQREYETAYADKYLYVDGVYYGVAVAWDGSTIDITRPEVTTGRLQVDEASVDLTVIGENGRFLLRRENAAEILILPVGSYTVQAATLRRTAKNGQEWSLQSKPGNGPAFEIKADAEASIKVGGPLAARAQGRKSGDSMRFELVLTGEDGLSYQLGFQRWGQPPPPKLLVRAKEGDWQKRYAFAYG